MTTVTISLPNSVAKQLDFEAKTKGFATRSEFIRSLLRRYFTGKWEFEGFRPIPLAEIKFQMAKTGKYSQKFIESVIRGLSKSSFYGS